MPAAAARGRAHTRSGTKRATEREREAARENERGAMAVSGSARRRRPMLFSFEKKASIELLCPSRGPLFRALRGLVARQAWAQKTPRRAWPEWAQNERRERKEKSRFFLLSLRKREQHTETSERPRPPHALPAVKRARFRERDFESASLCRAFHYSLLSLSLSPKTPPSLTHTKRISPNATAP